MTQPAMLRRVPMIDDKVTVVARDGTSITGRLIRTYNGIRDQSIRGVVVTGPDKNDFAAGFLGFFEESWQ